MYQLTARDAAGSTTVLPSLPAPAERRSCSTGPALARPRPRPAQPPAAGEEPVVALLSALPALLRLRGVSYVCVVDAGSGDVAGDRGTAPGDGVPLALVAWARTAGADAEDAMVATTTGTHLVQRVRPAGGPTAAWVYLHIARDRGTVAVPRRALAALAGPRRESIVAAPAVRPAPASSAPAATATSAPAPPAPVRPAPAPPEARLPLPRRPSASLPPPPSPRRRPAEFLRPRGGRGAASGPGRASALPRAWANDLSTLQRLLVGLRQLA
jgi:hypothetical protein